MAALRRLVRRIGNAIRPGAQEADLERELLAHAALIEAEQLRRGVSPDEAHRAARRAIGSIALIKDWHRDARSFPRVDDLRRDVRYASRTLIRFPAFTVVVLLTLAIGIGANAAIFSAVHGVLLTPLPYPHAEQLVRVWENVPGVEIGDGRGPDRRYGAMEVQDLLTAASRAMRVTHLANYGLAQVTVTVGTDVTRVEGFAVSGDLFPLLGVPPLVGRSIGPSDAVDGRDHVVVLGYDMWQRFEGRADLLGTSLTFDGDSTGPFSAGIAMGEPYTIIGVMPHGFRFPVENAQFWVPRVQRLAPGGRPVRRETVARLAPGVSTESAAAELAAIRQATRGTGVRSMPAGTPRYELIPLHEEIARSVRPALLVLSAAVGIVLLIACVNVANLLLARGLSRQRELAIRTAIGAGRGRLVRQLLTESILLSTIGGAGGIVLAVAGVRLFRRLGTTLSRSDLGNTVVFPRLADIRVDGTVLGYAAVLSLVTGVLFGLIPAARQSRSGVTNAFHEPGTSGRTRMKHVLVVAEVALATLLLVGAGLLINSFIRLAAVDPGFEPAHVLTFQVGVRRTTEQLAFAEVLVSRLRGMPGVIAAAYARQLPLVSLQDSLKLTIRRDGVEQTVDDSPDVRFISWDYLQTLGITVVAGRGFTGQDVAGRPPVALVNEALVRRDFRGVDPIGQAILLGPPGHRIAFQIVGVVGNIRQFGLDRAPESQYFMDMRQVPTDPALRMPSLFPVGAYYAVRTAGDPAAALPDIRGIVRQLDPEAPVDHIATLEQIVSNSMTRPRMYAVLVAIFSAMAIALAAIGLYGVMAYTVSQRTREIGIRMALGAQRRAVVQLVLQESGVAVALGLAVGFAGAVATTRYLKGFLFGLAPLDPTTFGSVAIIFPVIALIASYVPARRATAIDPLEALRCE